MVVDGSNPQDPVADGFAPAERRRGLPIGNLTSQWFGGVYLTAFDHWAQEELGCPGYVRYVDDFLLFANSKAQLAEWRGLIAGKLAEFRLRLNERKSRVFPSAQGVTFLGQRVWPGRRRLCRENVSAARRRLRWHVREYRAGRFAKADLLARWHSWRGHAAQADTEALIERVKKELREILGATGK